MVIIGLDILAEGDVRVGYSKAEVRFILGKCHPLHF